MEKTLHIKANPGSPNTFWEGQSGRYYRTKRAAAYDKASEAVNPDDYRLTDTDTDSQDTIQTKKRLEQGNHRRRHFDGCGHLRRRLALHAQKKVNQ